MYTHTHTRLIFVKSREIFKKKYIYFVLKINDGV